MSKDYVVGLFHYSDDGWYGTRVRYIFRGDDDNGFSTKKEAWKYVSMFKKYVSKFKTHEPTKTLQVEISPEDEMKTYIYGGIGPSWSCSNLNIDTEHFKLFRKEEEKRLAENRTIRKEEQERWDRVLRDRKRLREIRSQKKQKNINV